MKRNYNKRVHPRFCLVLKTWYFCQLCSFLLQIYEHWLEWSNNSNIWKREKHTKDRDSVNETKLRIAVDEPVDINNDDDDDGVKKKRVSSKSQSIVRQRQPNLMNTDYNR